MKITFTKMQALGNDFIVIDCREQNLGDFSHEARRLCNRRSGIGADQLLLLYPSQCADYRMVIYNADGGEVEMCGNGIRCFVKYLQKKKLIHKKEIAIETLAGVVHPRISGASIVVDIGEPILEGNKIPVALEGKIIDHPFVVDDIEYHMTCVSVGNPHCVLFVHNLENFPIEILGPKIEHSPLFPNRVNVEFVTVLNRKELAMRVWERGAGETPACGTGACAALVASVLNGKSSKNVTVHLTGGDLRVRWAKNNHVSMTGSGHHVFQGEIDIQ